MDTQATATTETAVVLRKQLAVLDTRKQETESALARERATHARVTGERAKLVEELAGADDATAGWAHGELDRLDSTLRLSSRLAESFEKALSKIANEVEALNAEVLEVERVIRAEERAKALEAFRINLQQAARRAGESLDSARADLAALVILETNTVLAANGGAQHEANIHRICEPILDEFTRQQANLDSRGWRPFQGFRGLQFLIRPMTRG
jgi:hypothetical protein